MALFPRELYLDPIRKEIEEIVEAEGWSKESMAKMVKLDAFLRETLRVYDPQLSKANNIFVQHILIINSAYRQDGIERYLSFRWHFLARGSCDPGELLGIAP